MSQDIDIARRGKILIEPYAQLRFGLVFLFINLLFSITMLVVFGYYLWDVYQAITSYFALTNREMLITWHKFQTPFYTGVFVLVLFIISTFVLSARYTHQIYGPLVSINRFLDEFLMGKTPQAIRLREGDQLGSLVSRLNGLVDSNCRKDVLKALDELAQGKSATKVNFSEQDPYREFAVRVNKLVSEKSAR